MPQTSTCLWFDRQAEDAARHDVSVFPNSRITAVTRDGPGMPLPADSVLTVSFELDGRAYLALNGGTAYTLSPAVSVVVHCRDQAEVDRYWAALSAEPQAEQCGWLRDRFGLSWQIVPDALFEMLQHPDADRRRRLMHALMPMKKLDLAALQQAFGNP